jgi:predicted ABC-type ATPase
MASFKPNLSIIAGTHGVGKTTIAHEFLPRWEVCPEFLASFMKRRKNERKDF